VCAATWWKLPSKPCIDQLTSIFKINVFYQAAIHGLFKTEIGLGPGYFMLISYLFKIQQKHPGFSLKK
jgi:hypothetical protein